MMKPVAFAPGRWECWNENAVAGASSSWPSTSAQQHCKDRRKRRKPSAERTNTACSAAEMGGSRECLMRASADPSALRVVSGTRRRGGFRKGAFQHSSRRTRRMPILPESEPLRRWSGLSPSPARSSPLFKDYLSASAAVPPTPRLLQPASVLSSSSWSSSQPPPVAMASVAAWPASVVCASTKYLWQWGGALLLASAVVALLQAVVALIQYRTVAPPLPPPSGPTIGHEQPPPKEIRWSSSSTDSPPRTDQTSTTTTSSATAINDSSNPPHDHRNDNLRDLWLSSAAPVEPCVTTPEESLSHSPPQWNQPSDGRSVFLMQPQDDQRVVPFLPLTAGATATPSGPSLAAVPTLDAAATGTLLQTTTITTTTTSTLPTTTTIAALLHEKHTRGAQRPAREVPPAPRKSPHEAAAALLMARHPWAFALLTRINRFLVLLLPWIGHHLHLLWMQEYHLIHLGLGFTFYKLFGFNGVQAIRQIPIWAKGCVTNLLASLGLKLPKSRGQEQPTHSVVKKPIRSILVLGDSLAVGIGSVEEPVDGSAARALDGHDKDWIDPETNPLLDYYRIENPNPTNATLSQPGPVFPRILAAALAEKQNISVTWRSAGVDGGCVAHVRDLLLPVLRDSFYKGPRDDDSQSLPQPDCVVLLVGMNDLKQFVANPLQAPSPGRFRTQLAALAEEIRAECPGARIILPAMPIPIFHKNPHASTARQDYQSSTKTNPMNSPASVLRIFPLGLWLDVIVGFWDSQKQRLARDQQVQKQKETDAVDRVEFPSTNGGSRELTTTRKTTAVEYVPVPPTVVRDWYADFPRLLAVDGVHPNSDCYAAWARHVAGSL